MDFEETLQALHELVGQEVMVGVQLADADGPTLVNLSGHLRKAERSPALEVLQGLGRASPDDEALLVHIGGADHPAEKNYFALWRSTFNRADRSPGPFGENTLDVRAGGLLLTIVSRQQAEQHLPPPD